jgi:glucan phosphoethanolaminetransferase (alkaline phosphatase superfamily)
MKKLVGYATLVVLLHLAVSVFHGAGHEKLHIAISDFQQKFVVVVILAAPVLAAILLWTRLRAVGAWLLLISMAGAFVFGLYYHFIYPSPDNVAMIPPMDGRLPFQITAVLLAVLEALGCWLGMRMLGRTPV